MWPISPAKPWAPRCSRTAGHEPAADAGAERDQDDVVDADGRADAATRRPSRRWRRCRRRRRCRSRSRSPRADVERLADRQVRRGEQHAVDARPARGCRRRASPPGRPAPSSAATAAMASRIGTPPAGVGTAGRLAATAPRSSSDDAEHLRPADVDADAASGHAVTPTSARVFSSRSVLRMRTSARRLTKPGQRDDQLDGQVVAHLGAAVARRRTCRPRRWCA